MNNPFKGPGDKDLKKFGLPTDVKSGPASHPWPKFQGGGRSRTGPKAAPHAETDSEPLEMMGPEAVAEKKKEKDKAVLKKIGWVEEKTHFNTDAEIFAEFEVPEAERHRTLVEFQLWVDKDSEYVIQERAQSHLDDKGLATVRVPIRKGNTLESTFALKAKHCSGDFPDKPSADRVVTDAAEITCARTQVSGLHFPKDKSFIGDEYLDVICEVKKTFQTWKETHPKAQIVIFGHSEADKDGDAHGLSKTRANSAFLFLIGDVDGWAELGEKERWGCWEQQCMLRALGFFHTKPTGTRGPKTRKATEDFIHFLNEKRGKKFNPMLGFMEAYIRKELYREYMGHKREDLGLPSSAFRLVSGYPYVGCSAFNRYLSGEELHAENRRAVFVILEESENFPMAFPCKIGTIGPCEDQAKRPSERAIVGFRCKFYDEMVKKEKVGPAAVSDKEQEITEDFAIFASTIYGEAAASSEAAWRCVANVIMNRVGHGEWRKKKTPSEVISWRGFDAFTFKNQPYKKCHAYLTGKRNGSEKRIERMVEVITPIYQRKETDLTAGCTLYYSPKAQAELHKEQPKKYSKPVPADWDFSLLEEAAIYELLPTDDFKFYRYK